MKKLKNYTLLIVEDEVSILDQLSEYFEKIFKTIYKAKDGKEALKLFENHNPDIALLDIYIPFIDGLEVAKKIREKNKKTILVMLTAHTETDNLLKATELNLAKYIVKPIDRKKMKEFLEVASLKIEELYPNVTYLDDNLYYCNNIKKIIDNEKHIELTKNEILFLEYAINRKNQVISTNDIIELLYEDNFKDIDFKSRVKTFISTLRKKVSKLPLKNVYGIGYKLEF